MPVAQIAYNNKPLVCYSMDMPWPKGIFVSLENFYMARLCKNITSIDYLIEWIRRLYESNKNHIPDMPIKRKIPLLDKLFHWGCPLSPHGSWYYNHMVLACKAYNPNLYHTSESVFSLLDGLFEYIDMMLPTYGFDPNAFMADLCSISHGKLHPAILIDKYNITVKDT